MYLKKLARLMRTAPLYIKTPSAAAVSRPSTAPRTGLVSAPVECAALQMKTEVSMPSRITARKATTASVLAPAAMAASILP